MSNAYILIDASGSMAGKWSDTIGTINGYVRGLAEGKTQGTVTVLSFTSGLGHAAFPPRLLGVPAVSLGNEVGTQAQTGNATMTAHGIAVKPAEWAPLGTDFIPAGGTPLYDAISHIVGVTQADRSAKGILVIMTDGAENTSIACNRDSAKLLLDGVRARGWKVVQLGVDFDAYAQAGSLGTSGGHTVTATRDTMRSGTVGMALASNTMSYYAGTGDMEFSPQQKAILENDNLSATEKVKAMKKANATEKKQTSP